MANFYRSDEEEQERVAEMSDTEFENYSKRRESRPQQSDKQRHSVTTHSEYVRSTPNFGTDDVLPSAENEEAISTRSSRHTNQSNKGLNSRKNKPPKVGTGNKRTVARNEHSSTDSDTVDLTDQLALPTQTKQVQNIRSESTKKEEAKAEANARAKGSEATIQNDGSAHGFLTSLSENSSEKPKGLVDSTRLKGEGQEVRGSLGVPESDTEIINATEGTKYTTSEGKVVGRRGALRSKYGPWYKRNVFDDIGYEVKKAVIRRRSKQERESKK